MRREERVMRICSRAVAVDPRYAQAWALLAMAQSNLHYGFGSKAVDDGVAAAHAALSIDASIAESHCPKARRLEQKQGFAEAIAEIETALRLDPESWEVNKEAARLYLRHGKVAEATSHLEKAVAVMESDVHAWAMLVTCYHALGNLAAEREAAENSVSHAELVLAQDPSNGSAMSFAAIGFAALNQAERAREWLERGMLIDPDNLDMRYNFACMLAAHLGDTHAALRLLERNCAALRGTHTKLAETDPDLCGVRDDPRFHKLLADCKKRSAAAEKLPFFRRGRGDAATPAASSAPPRS